MKSYQEFLTESQNSQIIKDMEGGLPFSLVRNEDGVFFRIGDEVYQTSKYQKDAVMKVLQGGGKWQGKEGTKRIGIAVDGGMAFFRIGDEQFILSTKARREMMKLFK